MEFEISQKKNLLRLFAILLIALGVGITLFLFTSNILISFLPLVFLMLLPPLIRFRYNRKYREYLSKFGEDYAQGFEAEGIYDKSMYGFVPFEGHWSHCSVYADESGIVISRLSTKRFISWNKVGGYKVHNNENGKYLELNVRNSNQDRILFIPWFPRFSKYLPVSS